MHARGHATSCHTYDVIVGGSGPGGATAARERARRGQKVLLLERGQDRPVTGRRTQVATVLTSTPRPGHGPRRHR